MNLIFQRGDRSSPVGHALVHFQADDGAILATYVSVPPIAFDLTKYVPPMFAQAMSGLGAMGDAMVATPIPPIPEEVSSLEYLQSLADRRQDDLVFAGATMRADAGRLMADAAEAARAYGELYDAVPSSQPLPRVSAQDPDTTRFSTMTEREQLHELTNLTGRLRDSLAHGTADPEIQRQMHTLAGFLPAKYRAHDLVETAGIPGERGQRLAALYLERCYKLHNEEYLDLERIDREIEALGT